jgi:glycosidase
MNYNFAFAVHDFIVQDATAITVTEFDARLKQLREAFGPGVALNMQNLVDSHDATRIGSAVANPDGKKMGDWGSYFNWSQKSNNKSYNARKPTAAQLQKQKLVAAFQLLYLGSPMLFYGDEAGMWGPNDPDCRKPMVWADQQYEPETHNPDQTTHAPDEVRINQDLFAWYQQFIALRRRSPAIQRGTFTTVATDDARQVYAFRRTLGTEDVLVVFNRGAKPATFTNALLTAKPYKNVFTQKSANQVLVPAMDVVVLRTN